MSHGHDSYDLNVRALSHLQTVLRAYFSKSAAVRMRTALRFVHAKKKTHSVHNSKEKRPQAAFKTNTAAAKKRVRQIICQSVWAGMH